jgi:hypothetical protein
MEKIIGIILLACAGLIFQYSYTDIMESFFSPEVKLKSAIERDITKSLTRESPKIMSNIHHVKFIYRSIDALNFLKKKPPQFQMNKSGKIWLEVEILDLQDNEAPGFITQISVFDLKTQNKISEFGQTYYYKDFDKHFKLKISDTNSSSTPQPQKLTKALDTTTTVSKIENKESQKIKSSDKLKGKKEIDKQKKPIGYPIGL